MNENAWLSEQFEASRGRLHSLAYRILGSNAEAEDAVQESWLRLNRTNATAVENLPGWLTTVVSRICLDMLRARQVRREDMLEEGALSAARTDKLRSSPEQDTLLAEAVGIALLVVLETLEPLERVSFVLHDVFGVPFDEIARITNRSPAAARQLASRARRRVRAKSTAPNRASSRQKEIVEAFYTAARRGDFEALLAVLDPEVTLRVDRESSPSGTALEIRGAKAVGKGALAARIAGAEVALINGQPGIIVFSEGRLQRVLLFRCRLERVEEIQIIGNEKQLRKSKINLLAK